MDNVTECLDLQINYKSFSYRFYYQVGQVLLESGTALIYYKEKQVLLHSGVDFWYYEAWQVVLESRTGITKWGNFYNKV